MLDVHEKSCKPPWSPCPLTMITRARICESHPDLGDIIASAGVCCSAMLLLNAELGCWEKHSCHAAGPRVPLPGSEGYHSFPSCTWHMAFTMPGGAERTFSDKASVNLPCRRNWGHPVWSLQNRMQIPAVSGVSSGAADVPHLAVRLKYRTRVWLFAGIFSRCLKHSSVAMNKSEKLSFTIKEIEANIPAAYDAMLWSHFLQLEDIPCD